MFLFLACAYVIEFGDDKDDSAGTTVPDTDTGGDSGANPGGETGGEPEPDDILSPDAEGILVTLPTDQWTLGVFTHDLTGDAREDIVFISRELVSSGSETVVTVNVLVDNADGTWTRAAAVDAGPLYDFHAGVAFGDFDNDGIEDVAVGHDDGAGVVFGDAEGQFGEATQIVADSMIELAAGDLDSNGAIDLVACGPAGAFVIARGSGGGTFSVNGGSTCNFDYGLDARAELRDFDGDGQLDYLHKLVYGNGGWGSLELALGGSGTLAPGEEQIVESSWGDPHTSLYDVVPVQLPGRSRPTLVVSYSTSDSNGYYLSLYEVQRGKVSLAYGWEFGGGSFDEMVVGDADGDGAEDLIGLYQVMSPDDRSRGEGDILFDLALDAYTWASGEWETRDYAAGVPYHLTDILPAETPSGLYPLVTRGYDFVTSEQTIMIVQPETEL